MPTARRSDDGASPILPKKEVQERFARVLLLLLMV
jgi:hypothetical protein